MDLIDQMRACKLCPLCEKASPIPPLKVERSSVMFIVDKPDAEADLQGEPLAGREGDYFRKLCLESFRRQPHITYARKCFSKPQSGHDKNAIKLADERCPDWLQKEIWKVQPYVIVTLGLAATQLLLKLPKSTTLAKIIGKEFNIAYGEEVVRPWYTASYIFTGNKQIQERTRTFFEEIKKYVAEHR